MRIGLILQLVGVAGFVVVAATHVAERLGLLPSMGWGHPGTPGHYLDLFGALVGLILLPIGSALRWLVRRSILE